MGRFILIAFSFLIATLCLQQSAAFSFPPSLTQREQAIAVSDGINSSTNRLKGTGLRMAGLFDDIGKFFQDMGASGNDGDGEPQEEQSSNDEQEEDDAEYAAGTTRLLTIPAKSIKPGGLRLLLMFCCMGMQNSPEPNSWKADQPTREEYVLDMYYHDRTALLTITLSENEITIDRIGSAPSMSYLTQEGFIVDSILDELQACVTQDDVKEEDRLLQLPEPKDAIEKARESLAFS